MLSSSSKTEVVSLTQRRERPGTETVSEDEEETSLITREDEGDRGEESGERPRPPSPAPGAKCAE